MRKVYLYMPCPKCQEYGYSYPPECWTHGGYCGGKLYLDEHAYIHCERCGRYAPLMQMHLTCNSGKHESFVTSMVGQLIIKKYGIEKYLNVLNLI